MAEKENTTECQILEAAKKVFLQKGFEGARMQEIADEAGINKALLHYYFRSKEKMFGAVFSAAFQEFLPSVGEAIKSDMPLFDKIRIFVDSYINMLVNNPHLPVFILSEIHRNPDLILTNFREAGIKPELFAKSVMDEINLGKIRPINPRHLIINIIALCIFPFIGKPILLNILFDNDPEKFQGFLEERKNEVTTFIIKSIAVKS